MRWSWLKIEAEFIKKGGYNSLSDKRKKEFN